MADAFAPMFKPFRLRTRSGVGQNMERKKRWSREGREEEGIKEKLVEKKERKKKENEKEEKNNEIEMVTSVTSGLTPCSLVAE
jgi:hypothetical protein